MVHNLSPPSPPSSPLPPASLPLQVYKAFLEELHFHGLLQVADINKLFANLSELCEVGVSQAVKVGL